MSLKNKTNHVLPVQKNLSAVKRLLFELYFNYPDIYQALFVMEKSIEKSVFPVAIDAFLASNICRVDNGMITSHFRVSKVYDVFVLTDFPSYQGADRVWYLLDDESALFAKSIPDCSGKNTLDIGTGSGVLAIMASVNGAKTVTAIDISARAIALATVNAALNNCKNITFIQIGIKDFKPKKPFDYISFNPPFVPLPNATKYMLSGEGGQDGLALVHMFFANYDLLTHRDTGISIISMSPGDPYMSALERLFLDRVYGTNKSMTVTDVYGSIAPIDVAYVPFAKEKNISSWKKWLKSKGYTNMHYLFINIFAAPFYSYKRVPLFPKLEDIPDSGTWKAMYKVIQNTKDHA